MMLSRRLVLAMGFLFGFLIVGIMLRFSLPASDEGKVQMAKAPVAEGSPTSEVTEPVPVEHDVEEVGGDVDLAPDEKRELQSLIQTRPVQENLDFEQQVWVADLRNIIGKRTLSEDEQYDVAYWVHYYSREFALSPELVMAVMAVESNFDRFAVSSAGARGLMQIMPFWKKEMGGSVDNLFDIETNIRYGCAILRIYMDRHNKRLGRALGAYNGSLGRHKYPEKVFAKMRKFKAARADLKG